MRLRQDLRRRPCYEKRWHAPLLVGHTATGSATAAFRGVLANRLRSLTFVKRFTNFWYPLSNTPNTVR